MRRQVLLLAAACLSFVSCCCGHKPLPAACPSQLATAPRFPLAIADGSAGRCLVDAAGVPVLLQGDAAWSLMVALTREETETYLADRRARGFNALLVNLIEHKFGGPADRDGDAPFTVPGDLTTPNEKYFAHADWVIARAAAQGMVVLLAPAYVGYAGTDEGWHDELARMGPARCREYGRWVGRRYRAAANLVWVDAGDARPGDIGAEIDAIAEGIKEEDPAHLHMAHSSRDRSAVDDYDRAWLDLNTTYAGCETAAQRAQTDYLRSQRRPFVFIEGTYEKEGVGPACLAGQALYAYLFGARGYVFGHETLWRFAPGWQDALASPGARAMTHIGRLLASRDGGALIPDVDHRLVVDGHGAPDRPGFVAAARAADGRSALIYVPSGGQRITVDLGAVGPPRLTARWFDPMSGASTAAESFAGRGRRELVAPGDGPRVLVLDDAGLGRPAP